jgi:hypothetical protein
MSLPRFLVAAIHLGLLGACATAQESNNSSSRIYEMRSSSVRLAFSASNSDEYLAWLDEHRILFEGHEEVRPGGDEKGGSKTSRALFVWDLRSGAVARHTRLPLRSSMCFADGFISYRALRDDFVVRMEGAFGHEKEVTSAPIRRDEEGFNRFTCKLYQRASLPPAKFGGAMYPLRLASGVLEAIPGGAWVYDDTGSARYLNISTLGPLSIYPHKYSRYAGKYLFYHSYGQISETWAFSTDGSLDLLAYPPGPWGRGQAEPVRGGLLFRSQRVSGQASWDPGYAGLYIHSPDAGTTKLISGVPYAVNVAPDGCMLAAFIDPWNRPNRKHRLIAIDLCRSR